MNSIVIAVAAAEPLDSISINVRRLSHRELPREEETVHVIKLQLSSIVRVLHDERINIYISNFAEDVRQEVMLKVRRIVLDLPVSINTRFLQIQQDSWAAQSSVEGDHGLSVSYIWTKRALTCFTGYNKINCYYCRVIDLCRA